MSLEKSHISREVVVTLEVDNFSVSERHTYYVIGEDLALCLKLYDT